MLRPSSALSFSLDGGAGRGAAFCCAALSPALAGKEGKKLLVSGNAGVGADAVALTGAGEEEPTAGAAEDPLGRLGWVCLFA